MIVWINRAFGAGKTTLAEELRRRRPVLDGGPQSDDARAFRLGNVGRCVAARADLEPDALVLRADLHPPERLADQVLAAVPASTSR